MAYFTKEEIKRLINEAPKGSNPASIIANLRAKGHVLEGYTEKVVGPCGPKGDKGDAGPQGIRGEDGRDGKPGIDGRDGHDGRDGRDGKDGKDGSPDSPEEIITKINEASVKIDASRIANLPQGRIIERVGGFIETAIKAGSGISITKDSSGSWVVSAVAGGSPSTPLTGVIDGSNTVYTWSVAPNVLVVDQGRTIVVNHGFTVSGVTTTLDVAPVNEIYSI